MRRDLIYRILRMVSNVLFAILGIVLVICLYSFITIKILGNSYVNVFSHTVFQIGSNSMAPTITTNDLILVKLTDKVDKDDVITYKDGDSFITHRVISINNDIYVTKGDANNDVDKGIVKSQIVGKVVNVFPNAGVWFKVITTPKIIFLICITLFLFSLAFSYTGRRKLCADDDFGIYYSGIKLKKGDKSDR